MTPADLDLARRLVACARWKAARGREPTDSAQYVKPRTFRERDGVLWFKAPDADDNAFWTWLPDLTDDATRGVLLGVVREARQDPTWCPVWNGFGWVGSDALTPRDGGPIPCAYSTEGFCLVAALENAP